MPNWLRCSTWMNRQKGNGRHRSIAKSTRRVRLELEILEERETPAAIPSATLVNVPSEVLLG